jgi:hypothetical protein
MTRVKHDAGVKSKTIKKSGSVSVKNSGEEKSNTEAPASGGGIGTLGERTLHATFKKLFESDTAYHEVKYKGYVADIMRDGEIIEIQTCSWNAMRPKLTVFLAENHVTVVYPAVREKWLNWVDKETGAITSRRRSPKIGGPFEIFAELYKIKMFLLDPNLSICIQPVDLEEYRRLDGWSRDRKKGSTRAERIPTGVGEPIYLRGASDYTALLLHMPPEFTAAELAKLEKLPRGLAQTAMNVLCHVGAVECIGKRSRAKLYKIAGTVEDNNLVGVKI